jgi:hypothetical protein
MTIRRVLEDYSKGKITLEEAEKKLKLFSFSKVSEWGNLDIMREHRTGAPEVIFGEGKSEKELVELAKELLNKNERCIVTRLSRERMDVLEKSFKNARVQRNEKAGLLVIKNRRYKTPRTGGRVAVLCAGTSDIPKAEEARVIAEEMGCRVYAFYDVGVAGIHRLLPALKKSIEADVDAIIVAAGMEGALPSVVAGLVDVPVIGLPVSTGYGLGGKGETALYAMLQSCSPGLAAVNIDNGLGAGIVASLIANRAAKFRK